MKTVIATYQKKILQVTEGENMLHKVIVRRCGEKEKFSMTNISNNMAGHPLKIHFIKLK